MYVCIDMIIIAPNLSNWKQLQSNCLNSQDIKNRWIYGLIAWFLLTMGLYIFVTPHIYTYIDCIKYGFLFAFVVYGVFDFTNMVLFPFYPWWLTLIDIISGSLTCIFTLLLYTKLIKVIEQT